MKVLITGGAGFIGSHLAEAAGREADVTILDDFSSGKRKNLADARCGIVEGSIADAALVGRAMRGVDCVFHLAALASVPLSCEKPRECIARNVMGLLNVLEAAAGAGVKTIIFASSASVYGDDPRVPKTEDMNPQPRSPYAVTKLDGEFYCDLLSRDAGMRTVALRFFNVFGPRQSMDGSYGAAVPVFIRQALRGEPLTIFGDGGQTRDFVPVADIVSAMRFASRDGAMRGVFNCGHGTGVTIDDLAAKIVRLAGSKSAVTHGPGRPGDVRHSVASIGRLTARGWRPGADFDSALGETIAYFKT